MYIALLELTEKLHAAVEHASLKEREDGAENSITRGKNNYQLMPSGTFVPVPARDKITGDIIGNSFKIDGIGFSKIEKAKLFGQFTSVKDRYNFRFLFGDIKDKLKLYNKFVPGGYAKLAAMNIITELVQKKRRRDFCKADTGSYHQRIIRRLKYGNFTGTDI